MKKFAAIVLMLALSACLFQTPSKRDITQKSMGAETKQQLLTALGKPDDTTRLGPLEQWVYKASDGEVMFVIIGDQVSLQTSNDVQKPKP